MKRAAIILFLTVMFSGVLSFAQVDPWKMVEKMGRGTNLGNTLEAPQEGDWAAPAQAFYFDDYADVGYGCVRIPVRWQYHMKVDSPYTVDSLWMRRVEEVVDWGLNRGLVVIINTHHDKWLYPNFPDSLAKFEALWTQIAQYFKDKPDDLLFEIINEPYFDLSKDEVDTLNFRILNIIRKTNPYRNVIITGGGVNSYHAIFQIKLPDDPHIIAYFHYYLPFSFTHGDDYYWGLTDADIDRIRSNFQEVADWAQANNTPVLLGEFGASKEKDRASVLRWYKTTADEAVNDGFCYTVWDAGSDKITYYRQKNSWDIPQINILTGQAVYLTGMPNLPDTVEAEDFDTGGQKISYNDSDTLNTPGYYRPNEAVDIDTLTGGGYAVYFDHSGEWCEYTFNVDSAAFYIVNILASAENTDTRINLRFNRQANGMVYTVPQGDNTMPMGIITDTIYFNAEANLLRLTAVDSLIRIDKVIFSKMQNQNPVENLLKNPDFELGTNYWVANNCAISVVDSPVYSGNNAILVSERKAAWAAPGQNVAEALREKGPGVYTLSGFARTAADTGVYGKLTIMLEYGGSKHYIGKSVKIDTAYWTEIKFDTTLTWTGTLSDARFYLETLNPYVGNYYIDNTALTLDSSLTSAAENNGLIVPQKFAIRNYPNPFNPQTTIQFSLDKAADVKLIVYDIRGRAIRTLVDKAMNSGNYKLVWNGKTRRGEQAASGIYFAVLRSGNKTIIQKMALIR